ncbi:polycystin-1 [Elysia marginata]|uniref:Polycystin-1 n=1 Tax=Elysia marginata TaxID=1093978 RepID=A0AAV4JK64_9GAST|nr:polycystin-1 [Elysia marginata]
MNEQGTDKAASCVYDFASQSYSVVHYTSLITNTSLGSLEESSCRDHCHMDGAFYFLYENITLPQCLCGNVVAVPGCTNCDATMVAGLSLTSDLCNGQYTHLKGASSVTHDFQISISSSTTSLGKSVLQVFEDATFIYSGGPSGFDTCVWDFGDASTATVFNTTSVSHAFLYTGSFNLSFSLTSSTAPTLPGVQGSFQVTVVAPTEDPQISCPSSLVRSLEDVAISADFMSAWGQSVTWIREDLSSTPAFAGEGEGACETGWTSFNDRCIQATQTALTMNDAHFDCSSQGGRLLRFYSLQEVADLGADTTVFLPGAGTGYYTGALWTAHADSYMWKFSLDKAFVFRETLPDTDQGDCVQLSESGLSGVDCNRQLPYICEKDAVTCTGSVSQSGQVCYTLISTASTWDQANAHCSSTYRNGKLASSISSSGDNNVIANMLSGNSWIGLRATTLQGHFTWQDGGSLTLSGFANWASDSGNEACVSVNTTGHWLREACDIARPFVCQYFVGDDVSVPWKIAGTLPSDGTLEAPQDVYEVSTAGSISSSTLKMLPGSWFHTDGQLVRFLVSTNKLSSDADLALQIWRPSCSAGTLDTPGCNSNSPLFTCVRSSSTSCTASTCVEGEYFCLLSQSCEELVQPCNCAGMSPLNPSIDCVNPTGAASLPTYQLVHSWIVQVPAGTARIQFTPPQGVDVLSGDILGFQTAHNDLVQSEASSNSQWKNTVMSRSVAADWLNIGTQAEPSNYNIDNNFLFEVSAVFTDTFQTLVPGSSLSYITSPGDYSFSAMLGLLPLGSCSVTVVDEIAGFLWVFPEPTQTILAQGSTSSAVIKVASDQAIDLVVKILKGTNPTVSWTLSGGSTQYSNSLESQCPTSASPVPESCSYSSSFLSAPYARLTHSFTSGVSPVSLTVHVSNDVSFAEMRVSVQVITPVTNVEFYHEDCQSNSNCVVYVEEGALQEFFVRASGDLESIVYYQDGATISPTPTSRANHSMTFSKVDDVVLSVNVSNAVSWAVMDLTVHPRIRANFGPVNFVSLVDKVAVGETPLISASASVTFGAPIFITWIIGDVNSTYTSVMTTTTVTPTLSAFSFQNSGNVSVTILLEDLFGDSVSDTMIVEVYKIPDIIVIASSITEITTGEQFELFMRVDNCSSPDDHFYGQMSFSVDWGTGSAATTVWTDMNPIQSLIHQIDTAGSYTVLVTVTSVNSPSNTRSASLVLNLHEAITGLRLTYDGPKHVSDQITFTASVNSGTSVMYTLEYGDGASSLEQSTSSFIYRYALAGVYKAVIRAQNTVSKKGSSLTLYAYDERLVQIIRVRAPRCSPVNSTVSASTEVAAQLPDSLDYTWNFGNGDVQTSVGLDSASTVYHNIGNFFISLEVENVTASISDNYNAEICIEEAISGLDVQFHSPVALLMPGAVEYVEFVASVVSGSNMTYEWTVNDVDDAANYDVLNLTVTQAGTYNVTVQVANDLDSKHQDIQLVAMEVITGLTISCLNCSRDFYCVSQINTSFQATKDYGTHENYTWTLNKGSSIHEGDFVVYEFLTAGNYTLDLISMNEVSTVRESAMVFVQDIITGFMVQVSQSTVIVDTVLTFQGIVSTGTSLNFQWACDKALINTTASNILLWSFPSEGYHNCSVSVFNDVSSDEDSLQMTVLGRVANVSVNHSLVPSQDNPATWCATVGQVYSFHALLNTQFLVTYQWEITQIGSVLQSFSSIDFTYSFLSPGSYNVSLEASNSLSSDTSVLAVTAQEPVSGVSINTSSQVFTIVGTGIAFEASLRTGSHVTYTWSLNGTAQKSHSSSVVIEFSSTGIFKVAVTAGNQLGQETEEVTVNVFEPVGGVAIQFSHTNLLPFVSLATNLGVTVPNVSGSDLLFQWTITNSTGDSVLLSNAVELSFKFASAGLYTIHIDVSNPVSSLSDAVDVEVQGAVERAQIGVSDVIVATGSSIIFSADVNPEATNLTYTWKIDGAVISDMESFSHGFPATGTYLVSLRVENNISSSENETQLRVLDPVTNLQISDCSVRLAQSLTIFKALVDSGTNLSYAWSVAIDLTSEAFSGPNLNYTFLDQGVYNVSLTASNDLGSNFISCQVEAHLPIGNVSLAIASPDPDYIFLNLPVTFVVSGGNLQLATFRWNISSQPVSVSSSSSYTVTFANTGTLDLTVDIENGVSKASLSLSFTIKDFLCSLPQVRQVGSFHRSVLRSNTVELEVTVDPQDCTEYIAVHTWSVYQVPDCNTDLTGLQQVNLGNTSTHSPALVIKARTLALGSYCVQFLTSYHYTSVSETTYYTLNVTSSALHAVIKGGTRRTVAIGSELCLDATSSYDPDDLVTPDALVYTWQCTETNATGGCFGLESQDRFCYSSFSEGTYKITLSVSSLGRASDDDVQIIEVLNVPHFVPLASVVCASCLSLSNYRISCSQHVALSAGCDNCQQCDPDFSWKIYEGQQELRLDTAHTSTGVNSANLVLSKWGAIKDDIDYTFVVYVSCTNSSVGTASLTLPANRPPSGGSCQISPSQIVPLQDQVMVSCLSWFDMDDTNSAILYSIYVDLVEPGGAVNQSYPLYTGTDAIQHVYLGPYGGDTINLRVIVSDEFGAAALGGQSTITFLSANLTVGQTQTDYLSKQTDKVLSRLTRQASPVSLLQYAIALGQQLNDESRTQAAVFSVGQGGQEEQRRAAIRDAVTICLTTSVPMSTLVDVQQMAYALKLLTDYSAEYLTEDSQLLMMQTVDNMLDLLQVTISTGLDRGDIPTKDILSVLQNVLAATNARVYSAAEIWASGRMLSLADFSTDFQVLRPEISQAVGHMSFQAISLDESHRQRVISSAMPLVKDILIYTLSTMMVGEKGIELSLNGATIKAYRAYTGDIEFESVSNSSQVHIAKSMLECCKSYQDEVLQVMVAHNLNPYTYGEGTLATMPVQTVSFFEPDGTAIRVSQLPENSSVQLYMLSQQPSLVNPAAIPSGRLMDSSLYNPSEGMDYKIVTIPAGKSKLWTMPDVASYADEGVGVHIQLRFQFLTNTTGATSSLTFYLRINARPDSENYNQKLVLTPASMRNADHRSYTFFLRDMKGSDTLFVAATNDNGNDAAQLSVGSYFSNCQYFDTSSQLWSRSGCEVQDESTAVITSCICNHLTAFGGAGIVSISDISFEDLDNLDLNTNPVVFIALAVVLVLFVITGFICRYLDRLDLRRISRIPLCGRDGPFKYEVTLATGRQFGSGTTAHIGLKLYGEHSKGEARHVSKPGAFQRGSRDVFHIAHSENLGELTKLLVWHDNMGLSPAWFLSYCTVRDLQTGAQYTFLVDSWLSLEMDDGVVQKTIKVAGEEEVLRFKTRFTSVLSQSWADVHAWLSVVERPDHSRFTRVQRAMVLLTCVYLYMCINAVWYGAFHSREELERETWQDSFGWEEVIVALASAMMVLPFLFGLSFVFKRSRCKESMFQEVLRPTSAQTLEIEAMCDLYSRDEGSFRTVTPLGEWIPAIDRESTTESMGVPIGLKRTVPMHRFARKGSSDNNMNKIRPPVLAKKQLWSRDNIMQSWPDRMPTWIKQVKAQVKVQPSSSRGQNIHSADGGGDTSLVSRRSSRSAKTLFSGSKSIDDSDDDLQQRLDEMDAEIARDEERNRKRKLSQDLRKKQDSLMELFDSDDEWVNEGLEELQTSSASRPPAFNPRREPELTSYVDRRNSKSGSAVLSGSSVRGAPATTSSADSRRESRERARPTVVSASTKSKSTLSDNCGLRRSTSNTTSQGLPVTLLHSRQRSPHNSCFPLLLPHWCVYLAYAVCIKLCLLAAILVLLYGYSASLKWVVSLCCSVAVSILVVEPLRVLFMATVPSLLSKDGGLYDHDTIDLKPTVEANEQIKDIKFRPLGGFALLQAKLEGKKKLQLQTMLREVVMFTLMFALLLAITFINFSGSAGGAFFTLDNIHNKLYLSTDTGLNLTNLKGISNFWEWSEAILAPAVHHRELQGTESYGYLMGPAQMRQFRTGNVTCLVDSSLFLQSVPQLITRRCVDPDAASDPLTQPFKTGWLPTQNSIADWIYFSASQLALPSKFGQQQLFPGTGYVQHLGVTFNSTLETLTQLQNEGWLDLNTRAVFVEFCVYNPSHDLTSCVTVLIEFAVSGGVLTSSTIQTERLLRFSSGVLDPLMVCQVMFSLFLLYLLVILISRIRSQSSLEFLSQVWNWVDLLVLVTACTQSALYVACIVTANEEIDNFLSNRLVTSPLGMTILLHGMLRWAQGLLVFLLCFKLYGSCVASFRNIGTSLGSLLGLLGGRMDFSPFFRAQRILTHIFFLSFAFVAYGLVLCLSLAILTWSLRRSREQMSYKTSLDTKDYEMIDFMLKRFKLIAGIDKPKPAFRHVKFAGLPSLPSRATSSNLSSRQSYRNQEDSHMTCSSGRPSLSRRSSSISDCAVGSEDGHSVAVEAGAVGYTPEMDEAQQSMDYLMASVLPTWEQVLRTLQKVEDLDKSEEDSIKQLQEAIKKSKQPAKWATQRSFKFKVPSTKPIMGKPPLDPKATFARFKGQTGSRSITVLAGRSTMTPPSTFTSDNALGQYTSRNLRPFSDQGLRQDHKRFVHLSPHGSSKNSCGDSRDPDDCVDVVADVEEIMSKCQPSYGRPPSSIFSQRRQSSIPDQASRSDSSGAERRRHSIPASASSTESSSTGLRRGSPGPGFFTDNPTKSANTTLTNRNSASSMRSDVGSGSIISSSNSHIKNSSTISNNYSNNTYSNNTYNSSSSSNTVNSHKSRNSKSDLISLNKFIPNFSSDIDKSADDETVGAVTAKRDKLGDVPDVVSNLGRRKKNEAVSGSFSAR